MVNIMDHSENQNFVGLRIIFPVLDPSGQLILNRSLSQVEYINVIKWKNNPQNENVTKYRVYEVRNNNRTILAEIEQGSTEYWHRGIQKDRSYIYQIVAVNDSDREGIPVFISL